MKRIVISVLALTCAGVLLAKGPAAPANAPEDAEESGVLIDGKTEAEEAAPAITSDVNGVPGIPSSYGQCKGIMLEGGRNLLVFESQEDGTISLVRVTVGTAGASWKLIARIPRSSD